MGLQIVRLERRPLQNLVAESRFGARFPLREILSAVATVLRICYSLLGLAREVRGCPQLTFVPGNKTGRP